MTQLTLWNDGQSSDDIEPQPDFDASIRRVEKDGETFYSLVDVMEHFTDLNTRPDILWKRTRARLSEDKMQLDQNVIKLKLTAKDGKQRAADCATAKIVFRIIQSIPSEKAEPIKQWFADLAHERIEAIRNPEQGLEQDIARYTDTMERRYGLDRNAALRAAIKRLEAKVTRNTLTEAMKAYIIDAIYYGQFTNVEYRGLFGKTAEQLTQELDGKPRDTMTPEALNFVDTAERVCERTLKQRGSMTFSDACVLMGQIAGALGFNIRELEQITGLNLVTGRPLLGGAS